MQTAAALLVPFEVLHGPLVFFRRRPGPERAEIAPSSRLRVFLSREQAVFTTGYFSDHGENPFSCFAKNIPGQAKRSIGTSPEKTVGARFTTRGEDPSKKDARFQPDARPDVVRHIRVH
jgi:hypothetical protein